jgi:hypothetical protein
MEKSKIKSISFTKYGRDTQYDRIVYCPSDDSFAYHMNYKSNATWNKVAKTIDSCEIIVKYVIKTTNTSNFANRRLKLVKKVDSPTAIDLFIKGFIEYVPPVKKCDSDHDSKGLKCVGGKAKVADWYLNADGTFKRSRNKLKLEHGETFNELMLRMAAANVVSIVEKHMEKEIQILETSTIKA